MAKCTEESVVNAVPETPVHSQICVCYDVFSDEIECAIASGACTVESVSEQTYACQGCGGCRSKIEALLQQALDLSSAESIT